MVVHRLAVVALVIGLLSAAGQGTEWAAPVVRVVDGDTLRVQGPGGADLVVRLAWIDAPEQGQPGGPDAKRALQALVEGGRVVLDPVSLDHYGRTVARVWAGHTDVGLALVASGWAWNFPRYPPPDAVRGSYLDAAAAARSQGLGLWADPEHLPVPPWGWRAGRALAPQVPSRRP